VTHRTGTIPEKITDYCEFGEGRAYVLWAIARKKQNAELTNSEEIVYRKVLRHDEHVERKYNDIRGLINRYDYTFRIYLSVNARDTLDAYIRFRDEMNDWSHDLIRGHDESLAKLAKIDTYWKSQLHMPENRAEQYFQFDLDDVSHNELNQFVLALPDFVSVEWVAETPNGYHVITEPFNHYTHDSPVEYDDVDTDGQLHIEEVIPSDQV
jgi:hypothetical protein